MNEEKVIALIFGDKRAEKPYLEVRCHLDFIMYFAKLLDVTLKFKLEPHDQFQGDAKDG